MAERQFGPYRLVRQIAVGGMAEIHLAKTKGIAGFEKYVALKMIHPNFAEDEQFIEMLVDEAKIAVQLTHGNIAQTFDLGRVGETYYITMEFVDGADLYKVLRRGSEMDMDVALDVCAFVGKEVASALDYAHRKRDHSGTPLGIVHRDVSPQNVLLSHAGEVKLVDFGIAKATMKARQTAVGVIKGKYYYMSPEQAWGDPLDHRSDIFSAGIVLYEMITGQMLYLEEDLHKLLDMARKAEIAPPSRLRKGVPPQLEKIVMHALQKLPGERYQSAADLASDLERFLHAYSPVFTAAKVAGLLKQVLGEPMAAPADYVVEMRGGINATQSLDAELLAHDKEEIRDENSMIFRLSDLEPPKPAAPPPPPPAPAPPVARSAPRPTPARGAIPQIPTKIPAIPRVAGKTPTSPPPVVPPVPAPSVPMRSATPPTPMPAVTRAPAKPRQADEETRELGQAPAPRQDIWAGNDGNTESIDDDDLENIGERTMITAAPGMSGMTGGFMSDGGDDDDLDNIGERTLITTMPTDPGTDTNVGAIAPGADDDDTGIGIRATDANPSGGDGGFEEGPTTAREFANAPPVRRVTAKRAAAAPPPPALSAKIQTPAVSELRKPRASRRTPPGGVPTQSNVLQAVLNRANNEPMPSPSPTPRRAQSPTAPMPMPAPNNAQSPTLSPDASPFGMSDSVPPMTAADSLNGIPAGPLSQSMAAMPPSGPLSQSMYAYQGPAPNPQPRYQQQQYATQPQAPAYQPQQQPPPTSAGHDATGMPLGLSTPPPGYPVQEMPGVPAHLQPYAHGQGMQTPPGMQVMPTPPGMQVMPTPPGMQPMPQMYQQPQPLNAQGYPQMSPGQMYPFQPYGQPYVAPTLTGQMRAYEVDEMPSHYKLRTGGGARWVLLAFAGVFAISAAAAVTYFIIRSTREAAPTVATVRVVSVPPGANVFFDGQQLTEHTPMAQDGVPIGTHHEVRVELAKHKAHSEAIDIPKDGREVAVTVTLEPITGQLLVNSVPDGADIYINNEPRGRTPATLQNVDMDSAKILELRRKDYQPVREVLSWPDNGKIEIDAKLVH